MRQLGVIGGMSWESTAHYYRLINECIRDRLGGLHSAELVLWSVDFALIERYQAQGNWERAGEELARAARGLVEAGCEGLLLATNTMHKVAPAVAAATDKPLLHIADCTGRRLRQQGVNRVGLLGTAFTMEQAFYRDRLRDVFNLDVIVPDKKDRQTVHRIIFEELCLGRIKDTSRSQYLDIVDRLAGRGAEAVILGCTEIGMLIKPEHTAVPLVYTTELHARAAVEWMLELPGVGE